MSFIKKIFSKNPAAKVRQLVLSVPIDNLAIDFPTQINNNDYNLVSKVIEDLISEGLLRGILIGKKGWFLPNGIQKVDDIWKEVERDIIDLERIGNDWGLNPKRVYIALETKAKSLGLKEPYFIRSNNELYLQSLLIKKLQSTLKAQDFDEENIHLNTLIENIIPKKTENWNEILSEKIINVLNLETSEYCIGKDTFIRIKMNLGEEVVTIITNYWEEQTEEIPYTYIGEYFGLNNKDVAKLLQKLINEKELTNVVIYPIEEIIKRKA
ncbi:MAG: hypothetical protein OEZ01_08870 [Candidatus Heimdallarchaeota archaeon]|nr:hypothetical protein [Candidatus Heimdallarchaeota archaeon]MDH5646106.1 hypothetical protein [Candidatus Heimdallarchaeota archaeon]